MQASLHTKSYEPMELGRRSASSAFKRKLACGIGRPFDELPLDHPSLQQEIIQDESRRRLQRRGRSVCNMSAGCNTSVGIVLVGPKKPGCPRSVSARTCRPAHADPTCALLLEYQGRRMPVVARILSDDA